MRSGTWVSGTRWLQQHYQSEGTGAPLPPLPPDPPTSEYQYFAIINMPIADHTVTSRPNGIPVINTDIMGLIAYVNNETNTFRIVCDSNINIYNNYAPNEYGARLYAYSGGNIAGGQIFDGSIFPNRYSVGGTQYAYNTYTPYPIQRGINIGSFIFPDYKYNSGRIFSKTNSQENIYTPSGLTPNRAFLNSFTTLCVPFNLRALSTTASSGGSSYANYVENSLYINNGDINFEDDYNYYAVFINPTGTTKDTLTQYSAREILNALGGQLAANENAKTLYPTIGGLNRGRPLFTNEINIDNKGCFSIYSPLETEEMIMNGQFYKALLRIPYINSLNRLTFAMWQYKRFGENDWFESVDNMYIGTECLYHPLIVMSKHYNIGVLIQIVASSQNSATAGYPTSIVGTYLP